MPIIFYKLKGLAYLWSYHTTCTAWILYCQLSKYFIGFQNNKVIAGIFETVNAHHLKSALTKCGFLAQYYYRINILKFSLPNTWNSQQCLNNHNSFAAMATWLKTLTLAMVKAELW